MRSPSERCRTAGNAGLRGRLRIPSPFSGDCSEPLSSPLDFRGEGSDTVRFQTPRIPTTRHLALLFHPIINFWPEGATCGQRWRCFPRDFAGPPGGSEGAGGSRVPPTPPSEPDTPRFPRHFHGATAPTSGQRLPSARGAVPLGCPPPPPAPASCPVRRPHGSTAKVAGKSQAGRRYRCPGRWYRAGEAAHTRGPQQELYRG